MRTTMRRMVLFAVVALVASGCNMFTFGANSQGQLGDSTTADALTPQRLSSDITWAQIDVDWDHTCGIKITGTAWCWGDNADGELGDGTTTDRSTPTQVGTDTDWETIAAGFTHTCAATIGGTAWCWGDNLLGQLGDGTTLTDRLNPTQVGTDTDWASITAGRFHTCGIKTGGTAWCWGDNADGRLGDGTTTQRVIPTQVGTDTDWETIAAGSFHTCATKADSTAWCWGNNFWGQLGDGTTTQHLNPTQVGTDTNWTSITAGFTHTCAVKTGGTAWCWGDNGDGQLGDGTTTSRQNPTQLGTDTDWASITAGYDHTCGRRTNDDTFCWGRNSDAQLGTGTAGADELTPVLASVPGKLAQIGGGRTSNCGVTVFGSLFCWGDNNASQIGDGTSTDRPAGHRHDTPNQWGEISAGGSHSCAVNDLSKAIWCWGNNSNGQLGLGGTDNRFSPALMPNPAGVTGWTDVDAGNQHTCAVATDTTIWCWGNNQQAELGQGTQDAGSTVPIQVGTGTNWVDIEAGNSHSCALKDNGNLWCWGWNAYGEVGNGTTTTQTTPIKIGPPGFKFSDIDAESVHTCGIELDGTIWCWGFNFYGQTLPGSTTNQTSPVQVGTDTDWETIGTGIGATCAIKTTASLWCWGDALPSGTGGTGNQPVSQIGGMTDWLTVDGSESDHMCGIRTSGELWCWGSNSSGQLGTGTTTNQPVPVFIDEIGYDQVSAGGAHTLANTTTPG